MKQTRLPLIVAHRGSSGLATENTLHGFEKVLAYDIDMIELDCRLTRDGYVVLIHDAYLRDVSGKVVDVSSSTYEELRRHKPDLAILTDTIELVNKRVPLMIEIKPGVPAGPIMEIVQRYLNKGWDVSDFIFASFDFSVLKSVHAGMPSVERIVLEVWSGVRAIYRARKVNTTYISMDQWFLWWYFVKAVSKRYKLFSYPYPRIPIPLDHRRPLRWKRYGLYGIITDNPEDFVSKIDRH